MTFVSRGDTHMTSEVEGTMQRGLDFGVAVWSEILRDGRNTCYLLILRAGLSVERSIVFSFTDETMVSSIAPCIALSFAMIRAPYGVGSLHFLLSS